MINTYVSVRGAVLALARSTAPPAERVGAAIYAIMQYSFLPEAGVPDDARALLDEIVGRATVGPVDVAEIERRGAEVDAGTADTMTIEEYRAHVRARRAARARR